MTDLRRREVRYLERATHARRWFFFRRPLADRTAALRKLIAGAPNNSEVQEVLRRVWETGSSEGVDDFLCLIAEAVPSLDRRAWIPILVELLDRTSRDASKRGPRQVAVETLSRLGDCAVEPLSDRLLKGGDDGARWVLYALRQIGVRAAGNARFLAHQKASAEHWELMLQRLSALQNESWDDVLTLLTTMVTPQSADRSLLDALIRRLNQKEVERVCVLLWAHARSADARTVLKRYFKQGESSLKQWRNGGSRVALSPVTLRGVA